MDLCWQSKAPLLSLGTFWFLNSPTKTVDLSRMLAHPVPLGNQSKQMASSTGASSNIHLKTRSADPSLSFPGSHWRCLLPSLLSLTPWAPRRPAFSRPFLPFTAWICSSSAPERCIIRRKSRDNTSLDRGSGGRSPEAPGSGSGVPQPFISRAFKGREARLRSLRSSGRTSASLQAQSHSQVGW